LGWNKGWNKKIVGILGIVKGEQMKIVIETDGTGANTGIWLNDVKQEKVAEFNLSINATRSAKLQMVREVEGKMMPLSFFAGDFKIFDNYNPIKLKGE
jgi:hypothetical protein